MIYGVLLCLFVYQLQLTRKGQRSARTGRSFRGDSCTSAQGLLKNEKNSILNWIFLAVSLISIFWDACFFYIPSIDDARKCVDLVKKPTIILPALRSVFDFCLLIYAIYKIYAAVPVPSLISGRGYLRNWWTNAIGRLFFDILAILPVPQVMFFLVIPEMTKNSDCLKSMKWLKYSIIIQHVPRSFSIYLLYTEAKRSSTSSIVAGIRLAKFKAAFNFIVCFLVAHVFGALWYFIAIERLCTCWKQACTNNRGACSHNYYYSFGHCCTDETNFGEHNSTILNHLCPIELRDPTVFDFGVFHDALQYRIVESTSFPQKFLYSFLWSINILSYGPNSASSIDAWESFFLILVWIFGILLIPCLFANVLVYLRLDVAKSEEMGWKMREIEHWVLFRMLSNDLQQQIRNYLQTVWHGTSSVNVECILSDLPRDISRHIKFELCLPVLMKVPMFEKMDEQFLDAMLGLLKLVQYSEENILVKEGNRVTEMLFIIRGNVSTTNRRRTCFFRSTSDGNFCGEELLPWALDRQPHGLPISTRTVKAVTLVEAFSFNANDLKEVVNKFWLPNGQLPNSFRYYSEEWRISAANIIQAAWNCRKIKAQLLISYKHLGTAVR